MKKLYHFLVTSYKLRVTRFKRFTSHLSPHTSYLIPLFAFCIFSAGAQPYKPCLDGEITKWSFLGWPTSAPVIESIEIVAFGDTLLNGILYKKLYRDFSFQGEIEENNFDWINHVPQNLFYECANWFIRESADFSKQYLYNSYWNEEYFISDIDLHVGDIFDYYTYGECIVDSINYENGLKHIKWHPKKGNSSSYFIESVGAYEWPEYPFLSFSIPLGMNCFQNQTTFYKNNKVINYWDFSESPCGYIGDYMGIKPISEDNYNVFIQKGKIEIVFTANMHINVSIYDINGRLCYSKNNISDTKHTIPTATLQQGIYILSVFNKEKSQMNSKKVMLY